MLTKIGSILVSFFTNNISPDVQLALTLLIPKTLPVSHLPKYDSAQEKMPSS